MSYFSRAISSALAFISAFSAATVFGEPAQIRVLSYNIHIAKGMDGKLDVPRIAEIVKRLRPDLAAIEEVDCRTDRVGGIDEGAELARQTGMHHAFGKALSLGEGGYGVVLLSRQPMRDVQTHVFAAEERCEPRVAVTAWVKCDENVPEIFFIGTHLENANAGVRLHQAKSLLEIGEKAGDRSAVLAGDFNAPPGSEVVKTILGKWEDSSASNPQPTCPADKPAEKIDYVFYRPAKHWRVVSTEVVDEPVASDHRPFLAVLEWR